MPYWFKVHNPISKFSNFMVPTPDFFSGSYFFKLNRHTELGYNQIMVPGLFLSRRKFGDEPGVFVLYVRTFYFTIDNMIGFIHLTRQVFIVGHYH